MRKYINALFAKLALLECKQHQTFNFSQHIFWCIKTKLKRLQFPALHIFTGKFFCFVKMCILLFKSGYDVLLDASGLVTKTLLTAIL